MQLQRAPLHLAASRGHCAVARALIEGRADVNARDFVLRTPLHEAALHAHEEVVKLLLEGSADVNLQDLVRAEDLMRVSLALSPGS